MHYYMNARIALTAKEDTADALMLPRCLMIRFARLDTMAIFAHHSISLGWR